MRPAKETIKPNLFTNVSLQHKFYNMNKEENLNLKRKDRIDQTLVSLYDIRTGMYLWFFKKVLSLL